MSMIQIPVVLRGAGPASFVAKDGGGLARTSKGQAVSPLLATVIGCSREAKPLEPALVPINWANASFLREPRGVSPEASLLKAGLAVLRKGGIIRHLALQAEPTKPAVGQIEKRLFASANIPNSRVLGSIAKILSLKRRQPEGISVKAVLDTTELVAAMLRPEPERGSTELLTVPVEAGYDL